MGKIDIDVEELVRLKEQGKTDREIVKYLNSKGITISTTTISNRLRDYHYRRGEERVVVKRKIITLTEEEIFEIEDLIEENFSYEEIVEHFEKKGKKMSVGTLIRKLDEYYKTIGGKRPKPTVKSNFQKSTIIKPKSKKETNELGDETIKYDDPLKEILMTGTTIEEYILKFGEENKTYLQDRIEKLKFLIEHSQKYDGEWICDEKFMQVINMLDKKLDYLIRGENYIDNYIDNGVLKKGGIDKLRNTAFGKNEYLLTYILLRKNVKYQKGYDQKAVEALRIKYEGKVDRYLNKLYSIENNREDNKIKSENNSKIELKDKER